MKTTIHIDGNEFPFGHKSLASALAEITDIPENKDLFDLLAKHPSLAVRREIAGKENIGEESFGALLCSGDSNTIISLLRGDNRSIFMKDEHLQSLLASKNHEVLEHIAYQIEDFDISAGSEEAAFFVNNPNPDIRLSLARNTRAPKPMLKQLVNDDDSDVRNEAIDSLSNGGGLYR